MTSDGATVDELVAALSRMLGQADFIASTGQQRFVSDTTDASIQQLAASHLVMQFAALLDDLPDRVRADLPHLPWAAVRGMRNRLAHGYTDTDIRLLWQIVTVDLPAFGEVLLAALREH